MTKPWEEGLYRVGNMGDERGAVSEPHCEQFNVNIMVMK